MTELRRRIGETIVTTGPLSIAEYMAMCLFDPEHGYYTTREPFGLAGDFTTAPEISQMFGEIVGVWLVGAWHAAGNPLPVTVAEIGPGRGTLMKDVLRTLGRLAPPLSAGATIAMVETSPRLAAIQGQTLAENASQIDWHESVDSLPDAPLFLVGNELFDAIPVRQYVMTASGWRERMVGLDEHGGLAFVAGPGGPDAALLPPDAAGAPAGAIVELAPARSALADTIAARIARSGGAALFIDYGYGAPAVGDTLQALRRHVFDDVLANPGEADLTAHVDFAALAVEARRHGLDAQLLTQADFLLRLGLIERAGQLGADASEAVRERLRDEVERLAAPDQMGTLFKALCIAPPAHMPQPFRAAD